MLFDFMSHYKLRTECMSCGGNNLITVIDYGKVPLAGDFPTESFVGIQEKHNLSLLFCESCFLLQTNSTINADLLFKDYRYLSSIGLTDYFGKYAQYLKQYFNLDSNSKIIEIGSNDGVLLRPMKELGIHTLGFEPSINVFEICKSQNLSVLNEYFNLETVQKYCSPRSYDLVTSSNSFAHIDDIHSVISGIKFVLKSEGHFIFEVHYGKNIIEGNQYENVYHEHIYYYTISSLNNLFKQHNMTIVDYLETPIHAGSIRVIVTNSDLPLNEKIENILQIEKEIGIQDSKYYEKFHNNVLNHRQLFITELKNLKKQGKRIAGYGASGRANILCNFCNLDKETIEYIIDDSPERQNRFIGNIPIRDKSYIEPTTDYIVVFAWNYTKMIIEKLEGVYDFNYIIPLPTVKIISSSNEIDFVTL